MDRTKLEELNEWWSTGRVDPELALSYKRKLYFDLEQGLPTRFALAVVGLRRVGKTTLLYQLIEHLLRENVPPTSLLFFSFDETSAALSDVLDTYRQIHSRNFRQERIYIFLDEIQKCPHWGNQLKKYYDLYPKLKFVLSGSESLFIRKRTKETMAGRVFEFIARPFSFREYLHLQGVKEEEFPYETRIKPFLLKYIQRGGFPETFSAGDREFKEYLRSLIIDKIVFKDIPQLFRLEDPEFLLTLLELISTNPGLYVDYQSLSQQLGKDRRVIKDYLRYLQESFLIRLLGNYRPSAMTRLRKKKRAYPQDTALIYFYKPWQDEAFLGRVVETVVANALDASTFWKNSHDVDFVQEQLPVEVKYQEKIYSEDYKGVREFMRKFKVGKGLIITKNEERIDEFPEGTIKLIPLWKWLIGIDYSSPSISKALNHP